ncbi:MAG TPA: SPFH domain-containing protein [Candidatus Saccharimonadia bacterium]|jgi:hypothetical protein
MSLLSQFGGGALVGSLFKFLLLPAAVISTVFKSYDFVSQSELALKYRCGRVVRKFERLEGRRWRLKPREERTPKLVRPGFRLLIPYADKLCKIDIRRRTHELKPMTREVKENYWQLIETTLVFRVICTPKGVYDAILTAEQLEFLVGQRCRAYLRTLTNNVKVSLESYEDLVLTNMGPEVEELGIILVEFQVNSNNVTEATQLGQALAAHGPSALALAALTNGHHGNGHNGNGHNATPLTDIVTE